MSSLFDSRARVAFVVACVVLILGGIGFQTAVKALNVYLKKEPVELRRQFSGIAKVLPSWQAVGTDDRLDEAFIEELGTDQYLTRHYRRTTGEDALVTVHLTYYTGLIDAVPHVPDRCLVAAGLKVMKMPVNHELPIDTSRWRPDSQHVNRSTGEPYPMVTFRNRVTYRTETVRLPVGPFRLRTTEFQHTDSPEQRIYAGYMFIANGRTAAMPEAVRKLAFDRTDRYAYYTKVEFTMGGGGDADTDRFLQEVADLLEELLPELMLCLPDWSEVEARPSA